MQLLRSRHVCGGLFHMRPTVVWLLAAFTVASCFAFVIFTLSYLSEQSTFLMPFGPFSTIARSDRNGFGDGRRQRLYAKHTRAINGCAEQQLAVPPTSSPLHNSGSVMEAHITGKIPNPFTNTSLTHYSIMLLSELSNNNQNKTSQKNMPESNPELKPQPKTVAAEEYRYSGDMPLIFIGGMPRSGTTLMRAMLDAHPQVRCGTETRLVPRILSMRAMWLKSPRESTRLHEAGITDDVIDAAVKSFILEIMVRHGELAPRLCNKDPFTLKSAAYLAKLFPQAKFIFMIRDGRATVTSIITRQVTITGFNLNDYKQCMEKWNQAMEAMWAQCQAVGSSRCLPVHYEQVVLHPEVQLRRILAFLELPWNSAVLHHEEHIGETGGVQLSKAERSTDQVIKPVNLDALARWTETFPQDVHSQLPSVAPMLEVLGYDPLSRNASQYGLPDRFVAVNTDMLSREDGIWRERQLASVLKGSDSYKFLEREYRLQQQQQQLQPSAPSADTKGSKNAAGPPASVVAAPNLKADFDV